MKRYLTFAVMLGAYFTGSAQPLFIGEDGVLSDAVSSLCPGDTLYIYPGVYHVKPDEISRISESGPYAIVFDMSMSGTPDMPIVVTGIPDVGGNRPIIDFSDVVLRNDENPEGFRITGFLLSGKHIHVSNLECTGLQVTRTDHTQSENFRICGGSFNTLENISCHDGMGIGFYINGDSHHNLIINCDAYNNYDSVSDISKRTGEPSGGNNDGFGCHVNGGMDGNVFIGCRAWRNSDDGFDLINCYSPTSICYCIAIENGFDAEGNNRADGNGVKGGGFGMKPRDIPLYKGESPRHSVCNNVAFANKSHGIYSNHHLGGIEFLSNTSVCNGRANYSMVNRKGPGKDDRIDVDGYGHSLRSNLSLSADDRHFMWIKDTPSDNELLRIGLEDRVDGSPLLAPRDKDGMLAEECVEFIQSFILDGKGADFSDYPNAIAEARCVSGCDVQ
ncbi:MAG: right-handed parallel beta-helix repeat-containing protein [Muribaculaceae bacterium]|nr:right-handed parallel beta-helix repeat-containing protein [Muribaculaceae bacterium]